MSEPAMVRRARPSERETVLELWLDLVEHHRERDPSFPESEGLLPALRSEIDRALEEPRCRLFVAEVEGHARGFTLAQVEADGSLGSERGCWIHELYVEPDWRRRGLGSMLVASVEAFFAESGGTRVSIRVEASNPIGLRFWERRGFAERARILERALSAPSGC